MSAQKEILTKRQKALQHRPIQRSFSQDILKKGTNGQSRAAKFIGVTKCKQLGSFPASNVHIYKFVLVYPGQTTPLMLPPGQQSIPFHLFVLLQLPDWYCVSPHHRAQSLKEMLTSNAERKAEEKYCTSSAQLPHTVILCVALTASAPVSDPEEFGSWIEGQCGQWTVGIMIRTGKAGSGGAEAASCDER